jgi:hypothetical protein
VRLLIIAILLLWNFSGHTQPGIPPVGMWREHLPYNSAIDVAIAKDRVYCATPYSLFSVIELNNSIERLSRVTGLSETGISCIEYDKLNDRLAIAYTNSNLDILHGDELVNIPGIKQSNTNGNKQILNIYPNASDFYLSTGLGIIVIDGHRNEVRDTWYPGQNGSQLRVNGFCIQGNLYCAATEEGLKVSSGIPVGNNAWSIISGTGGLPPGPCKNVFVAGTALIVQINNSLWKSNGNVWTQIYTDAGEWSSTAVSEGNIIICEKLNNAGRVLLLNALGSVLRTIAQVAPVSFPRQAVTAGPVTWIADQYGGLSHHLAGSYEQYKPNSPEDLSSGEMIVSNGIFYATAGEVNDAWNYQYNGNGIYKFNDGAWENINRFKFPQLDSMLDFIAIAVDAVDNTAWAGSFGGGLLQITGGGTFKIYKQGFLSAAIGDPSSYRVAGLAFDKQHNLWIANYGALQPLRVRLAGGQWKSFSIPFSLNENALSQIVADDNNYLWLVSPKNNGLICYDPGARADDPSDDHWKLLRAGIDLPGSEVLSIVKDKDGFVWVGTNDGVAVIQCPQEIFSAQACAPVLPIVQQGNFANYLFKGENVRSIAVDGANRKWIATASGAWLVSSTGEKVIYQFTENNSPLLSSNVKKIAIDGRSGEVFFATAKGICSFRGTATEGAENKMTLQIFPNPVPPDFSGSISIRGLANNSLVKITGLDGRLVYQSNATGGQMVWNGRDYRGRAIAAGVYLVLVSVDGEKEKASGKIVFVK